VPVHPPPCQPAPEQPAINQLGQEQPQEQQEQEPVGWDPLLDWFSAKTSGSDPQRDALPRHLHWVTPAWLADSIAAGARWVDAPITGDVWRCLCCCNRFLQAASSWCCSCMPPSARPNRDTSLVSPAACHIMVFSIAQLQLSDQIRPVR
jgi:hypothetical protein